VSARELESDVVVLGAGPAGAAVALGLMRLGHRVTVVAVPRRFAACEGVSERALAGMRAAGFSSALEHVPLPSPRETSWNGERVAANGERLIDREGFDRGLRQDLAAAGIAVLAQRVEGFAPSGEHAMTVRCTGQSVRASLVVEARGRAAPRAAARLRGPETVALLQCWRGPAGEPASCVCSLPEGWAWFARRADGLRYTQLCIAATGHSVPKRDALQAWLLARLHALPEAGAWIAGCTPAGDAVARSSSALLQAPLYRERVLRVGDAAMAVDPLSGNGMFQALSSSSVAPAVINTLLREPEGASLALAFYDERVAHVFERFARIGRDFYRAETRWADEPFWRERAGWPDDAPAHGDALPRCLGTARRPVVERGFIRERTVVLTSDQPLGVWRVADVEIAPLLSGLPEDAGARHALIRSRIAGASGEDPARRAALESWLRRYRVF